MDSKNNNDGASGSPPEFREFKVGQDEELRFEVEGGKGQVVSVVVSAIYL